MNIDERIDRLTGRHEALAQSGALLVQQGNRNEKTVDVLVQGIRDLLNVVRSHETRLVRLEDQA